MGAYPELPRYHLKDYQTKIKKVLCSVETNWNSLMCMLSVSTNPGDGSTMLLGCPSATETERLVRTEEEMNAAMYTG